MANKVVTLTASRAYQDIGTVGQTVAQLAGNMQSVNQILDVALRATRNYSDSMVRVSDLVDGGLATLSGNQLTFISTGTGSVNVQYSVSGDGSSGSPLQLVNDTASPGADYFYGTNGSGVRGWYALSSYSGTVTSVAFADGSTAPIYTVSGSPVTSSGTLGITLKNQTANKVFAGPASGGAAQPTFRSLVAADIPALAYGTVSSVALSSSTLSISGSPITTSGTIDVELGPWTVENESGTNYTLVLSDQYRRYVRTTNAGANTVTVPPNSSVGFPVGTNIKGYQAGAGQTEILPGSGVTINLPTGYYNYTRAQGSWYELMKVATDEWDLWGDLSNTLPPWTPGPFDILIPTTSMSGYDIVGP